MRVCKTTDADLIFGRGGPSLYGFNTAFVSPASGVSPSERPLGAPIPSTVGTTDPTFTSSMPTTVNPTSTITANPTGTIYTTIYVPPTIGTTTSVATTSVPNVINPTSSAQPSLPDAHNTGPGPETGALLMATGIAIDVAAHLQANPTVQALGSVIAGEVYDLGKNVVEQTLLTGPPQLPPVSAFGYDGLNAFPNFSPILDVAPATQVPICLPDYGLNNMNSPSFNAPTFYTPAFNLSFW